MEAGVEAGGPIHASAGLLRPLDCLTPRPGSDPELGTGWRGPLQPCTAAPGCPAGARPRSPVHCEPTEGPPRSWWSFHPVAQGPAGDVTCLGEQMRSRVPAGRETPSSRAGQRQGPRAASADWAAEAGRARGPQTRGVWAGGQAPLPRHCPPAAGVTIPTPCSVPEFWEMPLGGGAPTQGMPTHTCPARGTAQAAH